MTRSWSRRGLPLPSCLVGFFVCVLLGVRDLLNPINLLASLNLTQVTVLLSFSQACIPLQTNVQKKRCAGSGGRVEEKNRSTISGVSTPSHSSASKQMDVGLRMSSLVDLIKIFF